MNKKTIRCVISGKVQGVWYRASTKDKANELNITGYAKNLSDGGVEVVASGESEKLDTLYHWLHKGPMLAKVTEVTREELAYQEFDRFAVK